MTIAQPLPATRLAATASSNSSRQFHRLLALWANLTAQAAIAAAHRRVGFTELLDRQLRVERQLATRHGGQWSAIDADAIEWESTLLHLGATGADRACLYCRRARQGLPAELIEAGAR